MKTTLRFSVFVATGLLCGCASKVGGPVEIVYWTGWSSNEMNSQQFLIDEFNKTHPNIHVRMVSQFGDYQKVRIAFAGDATPDVMSTVWADELASFAKRGVLTPLDDYMKASGRDLDREFVPSLRRTLRVDGKIYALASTTNSQFLIYNKSILEDAHVQPPLTSDQLRSASQACTLTRPDGSFIRYGCVPSDLRVWAYVFGGRWADPNTKAITANDPHNLEALRWMVSFNQFIDPMRAQAFQTTFGSDYSASGAFFVGKVAMKQTGEWAGEFMRKYAPNVPYGFVPLPPPVAGVAPASYVNGSVFVIPKACAHKAEAWEFLNWICSPDQVRRFCRQIHNVPALMSVGDDPDFTHDPLTKFAVTVSRSERASGAPGLDIWPTYAAEITRAEDAAIRGGKDPKKVLDDLQKRMERENRESEEDLRP